MPSRDPRDRPPGSADLSDRALRILTVLVREYIEGGEPVSSLWLARHGGFGLSSATVRHILAELEERGYVRQPHTSAGRVPTDSGYRCYVNALLRDRRPARDLPELEARLRRAHSLEDLLEHVSQELSRASRHLGFAFVRTSGAMPFQHIDFVPLGGSRVLVVLVAAGGQVWHKAVDIGETVSGESLTQAANYLNSEFAGLPLAQVRAEVFDRLRGHRALYDALLTRALWLASSGLADLAPQTSLFVQGTSRLLEQASEDDEAVSLSMLRVLFAFIEEKGRLVRILNEYLDGPGLTVIIGAEHPAPDLRGFSVVASRYADGDDFGAVGVIGPRRMRYSRAIAAVDSLSRAVGRLLIPGSALS